MKVVVARSRTGVGGGSLKIKIFVQPQWSASHEVQSVILLIALVPCASKPPGHWDGEEKWLLRDFEKVLVDSRWRMFWKEPAVESREADYPCISRDDLSRDDGLDQGNRFGKIWYIDKVESTALSMEWCLEWGKGRIQAWLLPRGFVTGICNFWKLS